MASFNAHVLQAKRNLGFVVAVNEKVSGSWDWQITPAFYVAVHLVNAHVAQQANRHYRSHRDVKQAIDPKNTGSPSIVPRDIFRAYQKLEGLSRRARYLCSDNHRNKNSTTFLTGEKHFKKAILQLDAILFFFEGRYGLKFGKPTISCSLLNNQMPIRIFEIR